MMLRRTVLVQLLTAAATSYVGLPSIEAFATPAIQGASASSVVVGHLEKNLAAVCFEYVVQNQSNFDFEWFKQLDLQNLHVDGKISQIDNRIEEDLAAEKIRNVRGLFLSDTEIYLYSLLGKSASSHSS